MFYRLFVDRCDSGIDQSYQDFMLFLSLGFDDRFPRLWEYYLAFVRGRIPV
jgi:hypothetical protein